MSTLVSRLDAAEARPVGRLRFPLLAIALGQTLELWRRRMHGRAVLAQFTEHELHDVGLTRAEADQECAKPFWRQ